MGKKEKLLEQIKNNPKGDWKIDTLKTIADRYGIRYADKGTSHVVFRNNAGMHITVPAHRPIKPIYIRFFIEFIEAASSGDENDCS